MTDKKERMDLQKKLAGLADISHEVFWADSDETKRKLALANLDLIQETCIDLKHAIKRDATTARRRLLRAKRRQLAALKDELEA